MRGAMNSTLVHRKSIAALLVALFAAALTLGQAYAQGVPQIPMIFSGTATTADGTPVPDGYTIVARVEGYESGPVVVRNGSYDVLSVGPDSTAVNKTIQFFLGDVPAAETDVFMAAEVKTLNLTFPNLPEPTPVPTPEGSAPPTAADTPAPQPQTPAPVVPDTPVPVGGPMTYVAGLVVVTTGALPESPVLTAKIGSYESDPAVVSADGRFGGLVIDPEDDSLAGQTIEFYLNGEKARTTDVYEGGAVVLQFDIVFTAMFATPSPTPEPPTPTSVPPTPTSVPPTPTSVPPTPTSVPPTPTEVPVPPTATPEPTPMPEPTATSRPTVPTPSTDEDSEEESGGGCFGSVGPVSPLTGGANLALLLAPLGLAVGLRRLRLSRGRD